MSYQVLARKWRPRTFQDVVGQEYILRMLTNALEQKRIHHAYLFTGTRGIGKTTLGRILAKCLNCESGVTSTPCGNCYTCKAIDAGKFIDLFEVDAASRTKVEDTRELLENVLYPPTKGRFKIYLIDEVHMLSNHSFNALLKTLEEPPEHIKFLLATTDPKRLPITILSRCLQFHLKRINPQQISQYLQHICEKENIGHEITALEKIAKAADGSMRDALSLLDQAIAYGAGAINTQDVSSILGSITEDDLVPILEALVTQNGKELLAYSLSLAERAPDFYHVLEDLISIFHQIAINQIVPENVPTEDFIISLAKRLTPEDVQVYYQIALLGRRDLALAPSPQQGFEMTMLRMLAFKPSLDISKQTELQPNAAEQTIKEPKATAAKPPEEKAIEKDLEWRQILPKLKLSGMAHALASNCTLAKLEENKIELSLSLCHEAMLNPKLKERIAEALSQYFKKDIQLEIKLITSNELFIPLQQQHQEQKQRLTEATQTIMENSKIKKLIEMYDATVEVSLTS